MKAPLMPYVVINWVHTFDGPLLQHAACGVGPNREETNSWVQRNDLLTLQFR